MKFPRTIQLDGSDSQGYERLALPGEGAVLGSFAFLDMDPKASPSSRQIKSRVFQVVGCIDDRR